MSNKYGFQNWTRLPGPTGLTVNPIRFFNLDSHAFLNNASKPHEPPVELANN